MDIIKKELNKLVQCADGFHMSVQARATSYCSPRNNTGPYTQAEVGFPSAPEPLLLPFAEDPEKPTQTVYGYVPRNVIATVIAKHGGMISGALPAGFPHLYAPGAPTSPE